MRIRGLLTISALTVGALATLSSSTGALPVGSAYLDLVTETSALTAPKGHESRSGVLPPSGFVSATPRVGRSLRAAPPQPPPQPQPLVTSPANPLSAPGAGLLTVPVISSTLGIPELVLNAYRAAELQMMTEAPGCGLSWHLLAGIGRIESGHAGGGRTDSIGTTITPIRGPLLDGRLAGNEIIRDTDRGALDGDTQHDRAVGPMQFLPSTWARYASDGNADGVADPDNIFDAALAAARYLCSGGLDLRDPLQETRAVLRYNNSASYAANVITWSNAYARGGTPTPRQLSDSAVSSPGRLVDTSASTTDPAQARTGTIPPAAASTEVTTSPSIAPLTTTPAPVPSPSDPPIPSSPQAPSGPQLPGFPPLPPLPCLIFCPPPAPTTVPPTTIPTTAVPAPATPTTAAPTTAPAPTAR